jgi:hypothetical protein
MRRRLFILGRFIAYNAGPTHAVAVSQRQRGYPICSRCRCSYHQKVIACWAFWLKLPDRRCFSQKNTKPQPHILEGGGDAERSESPVCYENTHCLLNQTEDSIRFPKIAVTSPHHHNSPLDNALPRRRHRSLHC